MKPFLFKQAFGGAGRGCHARCAWLTFSPAGWVDTPPAKQIDFRAGPSLIDPSGACECLEILWKHLDLNEEWNRRAPSQFITALLFRS